MCLLHYMTMHIEQLFYSILRSSQPFTLCKHNILFLDPIMSHITFINMSISYRKLKRKSMEMESP